MSDASIAAVTKQYLAAWTESIDPTSDSEVMYLINAAKAGGFLEGRDKLRLTLKGREGIDGLQEAANNEMARLSASELMDCFFDPVVNWDEGRFLDWLQTQPTDEIERFLHVFDFSNWHDREILIRQHLASRTIEKPKRSSTSTASSRKVFVVHGHDDLAKESVARFLEKLGLEAIILHEHANKGRTVIEKFEAHADVAFAVVLLTPDDVGGKSAESLQPRPRQNVLLELGFFLGSLGREHVCALKKGDLELPSDYDGVLWTQMDQAGAWKIELAKEMKAALLDVDMNKAFDLR